MPSFAKCRTDVVQLMSRDNLLGGCAGKAALGFAKPDMGPY